MTATSDAQHRAERALFVRARALPSRRTRKPAGAALLWTRESERVTSVTSSALTAFAMRYNSLSERRSFDATRRSFDTASPALAGGVKNDRFVVGGMADLFVFFLFFSSFFSFYRFCTPFLQLYLFFQKQIPDRGRPD